MTKRGSHKIVYLPGHRFGMWTVLEEARSAMRKTAWRCRCDCGNVSIRFGTDLRAGSDNCGCMTRKRIGAKSRKHGYATGDRQSPEYRAWSKMKHRCGSPSYWAYARYGGRGIVVCDLWKNSFSDFLKDVGLRPGHKYSLDRINNDGNYEPGNVRWATWTQQANNKNHSTLTVNGITDTVSGWSIRTGVPNATIRTRLYNGWLPGRAISPDKGHRWKAVRSVEVLR